MVGHGRKIIYSDAGAITAENVVAELKLAQAIHLENERDYRFLYRYYRGITPIENKTNKARSDVNNKVVENRASEIVTFQTGLLLGEPIQYIGKHTDDHISDMISMLNEYMSEADKAAEDNDMAKLAHICGAGYHLGLPDSEANIALGDAPYYIASPSPGNAFVIYSSDTRHEPLAGVVITRHRNGRCDYNVYTKTDYFLVSADWRIVEHQRVLLDEVPLIEYPLNRERMGAFEKVLPLLDALNLIQSERVDDVEQFVKAFLAILGADLTAEQADELKEQLMLCLPEGCDAKFLTASLQQSDTQVLKNDIVDAINEICCMPNRNGGTSTSDTGSAVIYRDGWQDAETNALNTELSFRKPEKRLLRLVLGICRNRIGVPVDLGLGDVDIKFTRRNFANLSAKVSAFATLAGLSEKGLLHLKEAFTLSTLFTDPDTSYSESMKWREILKKLNEAAFEAQQQTQNAQNTGDSDTPVDGGLVGSDGGESSAS